MLVVDDHLLRDVLTGNPPPALAGEPLATTNLWLFRLCSAVADEERSGRLSAPVSGLREVLQAAFRARLIELPRWVNVVPMREIAWSMAVLQHRHRAQGHPLSKAMAEALAAAHHLDAGLAVAVADVGPGLQAAAQADGIDCRVI